MRRTHCRVTGIVQGIGFRPFVYRIAKRERLVGFVRNSPAGVTIEIQGSSERVDALLSALRDEAPPHSRILTLDVEDMAPIAEDDSFVILESEFEPDGRAALVPPDLAVCDDCLREMRDPSDRRHRYPFLNCTRCGPRFTIVRSVPYDRSRTSMAAFPMCALCRAEYENPADRRHHAEPTACPDCGPRVWMTTPDGASVHQEDPIEAARRALRAGLILAVKGLGGFHLAVNARDALAVDRLRRHKRREEKPLAVMVRDLDQARLLAEIGEEEEALLTSPERPIVLLRRHDDAPVAPCVAPHHAELGIMLPYTPLHVLVLEEPSPPLVMTSGNRSDEPIVTGNDEARDRLGKIADMFLLHDREIVTRADDSVVRHVAGAPRMLRRSRGFVPAPIVAPCDMGRILATGADLKNTVCVTSGDRAHLSQHIGDLEDARALEFHEQAARHLTDLVGVTVEAIAHDLHPEYHSTRRAHAQIEVATIAVQHHHAHVAAVMAEYGLDGEVIGVAWDGTGLGDDGTIWGGEWLVASPAAYRRAAHLSNVPLPGGDIAVKEPWRAALGHLHAAGVSRDRYAGHCPPGSGTRAVDPVLDMIASGTNSPLTSSIGRLFDAVASLVGIRDTISYEGQAAMLLEAISDMRSEGVYPIEILEREDRLVLDAGAIVRGVLADLEAGTERSVIGGRFHRTLLRALTTICVRVSGDTGLDRVVLSGGCFQNRLLVEGAVSALEQAGLAVFVPSSVPVNDGGIALGQAYVAAARSRSTAVE
jgi:hydrogenase maturation protein HypF